MAKVLFYDGECGFCTRSVRWVARRDGAGRIDFAPLQGELAAKHGLTEHAGREGTLVLLDEASGEVLLRSRAVLALLGELGGGWKVLGGLGAGLPLGLRDWAYGEFAKRRHWFFRGKESCELPDEALRRRMRE